VNVETITDRVLSLSPANSQHEIVRDNLKIMLLPGRLLPLICFGQALEAKGAFAEFRRADLIEEVGAVTTIR